MTIGTREVFGPVLCIKRVKDFEEGLALMNRNPFANGSVIFTQNGYYARQFELPGVFAPVADYHILRTAVANAESLNASYHVGNVLSSDTFYDDQQDANDKWIKMGVLCIEMETAALYMNAARAGKKALGMFTISDHILKGEALSAEERQTSFKQMMEIALKTSGDLD